MWLARTSGGPIDSIAVLPFVNGSGSPDADYLSDGLTDTITNSLSQIHSLRVVPRTLVMRYKNQNRRSAPGRARSERARHRDRDA